MRRFAILLLLALLTIPAVLSASESFKIIVHPGVRVDSISKIALERMFTKRVTTWPDGQKVKPVDQVSRSTARVSFTQVVHGKSVAAMLNYWRQRIFSGRGMPPPERLSDAAVVSYVSTKPGAVGYVAADAPVAGVKVIQVS